jgi:hypothetical protein
LHFIGDLCEIRCRESCETCLDNSLAEK